jgi:hypothetical protein
MGNVLRAPKSKDRFGGGSAAEELSPFNLSRMASADQKWDKDKKKKR